MAVGGMAVAGNTELGSSSGNSLTVNSSTYFNAPVQVQTRLTMSENSVLNVSGSAVLGSDSTDIITVNGVTTFKSAVVFQGPVSLQMGQMSLPATTQRLVATAKTC